MAEGDYLVDDGGNYRTDADGNYITVGAGGACCYRQGRPCSGSDDPVAALTGEGPWTTLEKAPNGDESFEILGVCYIFDGPIDHCPRLPWPVGIVYADCETCEANTDLEPIPCRDAEGNPVALPDSYTVVVAGVVNKPCPQPDADPRSDITDFSGVNGAHAFAPEPPFGLVRSHGGGGELTTWFDRTDSGCEDPPEPPEAVTQIDTGTRGFVGGVGGLPWQIYVGDSDAPGAIRVLVFEFRIFCGDDGLFHAEIAGEPPESTFADWSGATVEVMA